MADLPPPPEGLGDPHMPGDEATGSPAAEAPLPPPPEAAAAGTTEGVAGGVAGDVVGNGAGDVAGDEALFTDASQLLGADEVLTTVTQERDGYLEALQRLKAEFANHRRRTAEQATSQRDQAAANLVEKLLPVLDSCDAALAHDADAVRPIVDSLLGTLTAAGLERLEPEGQPFDPELHEAVMHEAGEGDAAPTVSQVLRAGYAWNGRVLRPAMVQVRG